MTTKKRYVQQQSSFYGRAIATGDVLLAVTADPTT